MVRITDTAIYERLEMIDAFLEPMGLITDWERSYSTNGLWVHPIGENAGNRLVSGLTRSELWEYLGGMLAYASILRRPENYGGFSSSRSSSRSSSAGSRHSPEAKRAHVERWNARQWDKEHNARRR